MKTTKKQIAVTQENWVRLRAVMDAIDEIREFVDQSLVALEEEEFGVGHWEDPIRKQPAPLTEKILTPFRADPVGFLLRFAEGFRPELPESKEDENNK